MKLSPVLRGFDLFAKLGHLLRLSGGVHFYHGARLERELVLQGVVILLQLIDMSPGRLSAEEQHCTQ